MSGHRLEILAAGAVGSQKLGAAAAIRETPDTIASPIAIATNHDRVRPGSRQRLAKRAPQHARSANHDRRPSLQAVKPLEIGFRRHGVSGPKKGRRWNCVARRPS